MAEEVKETIVKPEVKKDVKPVKAEAPKVEENHIDRLVKEVIVGLHGTGRERMLSLGDNYEAVQHEVNQLIKKGEVL